MFKIFESIFKKENKWIVFSGSLVFLFVGFSLGYTLSKIILNRADYFVDFTKENFRNTKNELYIDEDPASYKFGESKIIRGREIPEILSGPIALKWKPKDYPILKKVLVSAEIQGQSDWDISVVCPNCDNSIKYDWQPFYRAELNDYSNLFEFPDEEMFLYSKNEVQNVKTSPLLGDWMRLNIPQGSNINIIDNSYQKSKFVNSDIDFKAGVYTTIEKNLRGAHEFYIYLKDKLDLEIQKYDLNWASGSDEAVIVLSNMDDEVVYQNTILDDEAGPGKGKIVNGKYEFPINKEGVYKLELQGSNDWIIKSLKINTNKIILTGTSLILNPAKLYTHIDIDAQAKLFIWHESAVQEVSFTSEDGSITKLNLGLDKINIDQFLDLKKGDYLVELAGDQFLSGMNFAFSKEQFFVPFLFNINSDENNDYYVSNIKQSKINDSIINEVIIDKARIEKLENLNEITFELRNADLNKKFEQEKPLLDSGYTVVSKFEKIKIWSKNSSAKIETNTTDLTQLIKDIVPIGATVYLNTITKIDESKFLTTTVPGGFIKTQDYISKLDLALKGTHEFDMYLDSNMRLEIVKEDLNQFIGKDDVEISLIDRSNNIICSQIGKDDGIISSISIRGKVTISMDCPVATPGFYTLLVKGLSLGAQNVDNDFIIRQVRINTNKIVIKNSALNIEPIALYLNNNYDKTLTFFYWHSGMGQVINITGDIIKNINLVPEDINIEKSITLSKGEKYVLVPKGDVLISGSNFATTKDNWFSSNTIEIVKDANFEADYKIIEDTYSQKSFIPSIYINIK